MKLNKALSIHRPHKRHLDRLLYAYDFTSFEIVILQSYVIIYIVHQVKFILY